MTELPTGPSTTASLRSQMTEYRMRTEYRRVLRGVWLRADVEPTFDVMGRAAAVAFPDGTLCGWSAAHLWGNTALPQDRRPEIAVPVDGRRHAGVHVRRMQLDDDHITVVDDLRCTTLARTAIDLARFSARDDAVAALDVMTRRRPDLPAQMRAELRDWENHWGVDKAHRASRLIDPAAESPWETRLRLAVVDEGLDGWVCQWEVFGAAIDSTWRGHNGRSRASTTGPTTGTAPSTRTTSNGGTRSVPTTGSFSRRRPASSTAAGPSTSNGCDTP